MAVLLKAASYPMDDGCRGKLSRATSSYPGRHGAGGSMSQARMVRADWEIRTKVRK